MHETELKILTINPSQITKKLLALGAKKYPTVLVIEKAFDFKDNSISNKKHLLRLRKLGNKTELVYKQKIRSEKHFKTMEETETEVTDFAIMEKILNKLGLRCVRHREKRRTSFVLGKTKFEIDEYPGFPPYLEIEGSPKEIIKYTKLLGFTMNQTSTLSATQLLKRYKMNHKHLMFSGR